MIRKSIRARRVFPNVYRMLRVLAVVPVTTATNERSFSTIRRLKTYLSSTMSEDRLNDLAWFSIHRGVDSMRSKTLVHRPHFN